jgi:cysteinyl-tRNA synthetase
MDKVLALGLEASLSAQNQPDDEAIREIEAIIAERAEAKKAKDFARADGMRQKLKERGIIIEDGPGGTTWRKA